MSRSVVLPLLLQQTCARMEPALKLCQPVPQRGAAEFQPGRTESGSSVPLHSQRPQEVEDGLFVARGQGIEILDHRVGFRVREAVVGETLAGGQNSSEQASPTPSLKSTSAPRNAPGSR